MSEFEEVRSAVTKHNGSAKDRVPTIELRSSTYVVWLVALYAELAIFAWTITCILTIRPITTKHYGKTFSNKRLRT